MTMKSLLTTFALAFFALFVSASVNADQQIIIEIDGMNCKLWPLAIKQSLSATEGVTEVEISYEQEKAWMTVAESIENQVLIDAVTKAGAFKGKVIERKSIQ